MTIGVYAVKDSLVGYGQLFSSMNDNLAKRTFSVVAGDETTEIGRSPNDFDLFKVGELDCETGLMTPCQVLVARATEFRVVKE